LYVCLVNELVDIDFSLTCIKFRCLKSDSIYTIVGTKDDGGNPKDCIDTILRDDDEKMSVKRYRLKNRFNNIEPIKIFYEANKRSKAKRRK